MTDIPQFEVEIQRFKTGIEAARAEVGKVHRRPDPCRRGGPDRAASAGGHILLEGVPGLGKTELVKALSRVLDLQFRRIQFTLDLMPADIVGTTMMNASGGGYHLESRQGPVFTQPSCSPTRSTAPRPRLQSALLETMQEWLGHHRRDHPSSSAQPFIVLATQNPLEQEGTYPLPEAQPGPLPVQARGPLPEPSRAQ